MEQEKNPAAFFGVLLSCFMFGLLPPVTTGNCTETAHSLNVAARTSENGSDIDCGEKHVIFIKEVEPNDSLLEAVQQLCVTNHTCDITSEYGQLFIVYYCVNESLIEDCKEIQDKDILIKKYNKVQCYKYTTNKLKSNIFPCTFIPTNLPNNRWLILQNQRMIIKRCKNCSIRMRTFYHYNIPNNDKALQQRFMEEISYNCKDVVWFLHFNSDDCDGIFEEFFLTSKKFNNSKNLENETVAENITGIYTKEVETVSHSIDTTSLLPFQELSSHDFLNNVDKRMFPREVVNYLTIGIAGGLTLITLTVCLIVILRRSKQKSVGASPPPGNGLYGCTHLPEDLDPTSPEEENTYFTVEADDDNNLQKKVEENTYNSIDEVKGSSPGPVVERYSKLKSPRTMLEKTPSFTIKNSYDQIVEEMVQGRINSNSSSLKKGKQNGSLRKTGSFHRQTSKDSKTQPDPAEVAEYNEMPCYQSSSLSPEYYDRALPVEPTAPPLIESDSASEPEAIYERVDDLLNANEDGKSIYETVTEEPHETKSQYSTLPRQTEDQVSENYTPNSSLKLNKSHSLANGNLPPPRIYDHICDQWNDTDTSLLSIPSDGYVFTHIEDDNNTLKSCAS